MFRINGSSDKLQFPFPVPELSGVVIVRSLTPAFLRVRIYFVTMGLPSASIRGVKPAPYPDLTIR